MKSRKTKMYIKRTAKYGEDAKATAKYKIKNDAKREN